MSSALAGAASSLKSNASLSNAQLASFVREAINHDGTLVPDAKPLILGIIAPNAKDYAYEGLMDELAIYDRTLDAEEVQHLRQLGMRVSILAVEKERCRHLV